MLILSHREELVRQPLKYFDCPKGVEMAAETSKDTDEVVSASVASLCRRLDRFDPYAFDTIICDEAHHSAASTYKKIFEYFKPRLLLGFTATPGRGDKVRLDDIYDKILYQRDLRWGIEHGYLCDILCKRAEIGFDLTNVRTSHGDYAPGELEEAMDGTADAIAQCYRDHAKGATLIFAVSVHQCEEIARRIPGAVVVCGTTKNRAEIIERFTNREIPCIVNCMVFTEGTDMPLVETVIIARPTRSDSLYAQMVGRGLRLHPEKKNLTLIDCVGVTGKASLCTAPSLLGLDLSAVPKEKADEIEGLLFELPLKISAATDCPQSWIKNIEIVDIWAKQQMYQTHDVNYFKMPDGSLVLSLLDKERIVIGAENELGEVRFLGRTVKMQEALDEIYSFLLKERADQAYIWDLSKVKKWGKAPASDKQLNIIKRRFKTLDTDGMTKLQAGQILNRILGGGKIGKKNH